MTDDIRTALYAGADDLLDDFIAMLRRCAGDDVWLQTQDIGARDGAGMAGQSGGTGRPGQTWT
jgi:hypothetical protein